MNEQFRSSSMAMLGIGSYTATEAARLLGTSTVNIRRWMGGYSFGRGANRRHMEPLWSPQIPRDEDNSHVEIGFRDLIELRFILAFTKAGLGLKAIRNCLDLARELVRNDRPFATRQFRTDGHTIFLKGIEEQSGKEQLLDLKKRQFAFEKVIDRTFKDLDIKDDEVARWRPYQGRESIVIDPARAFGQPIAASYGVPTIALADAVEAEGSVERAARLFEVASQVVRDAVKFERSLHGAS